MQHLQFLSTEDNSTTLFNPELNETYHSIHGAITESKHVFIKNGLQFFFENKNSSSIRILEIGFGTGLNALLSYLFCIQQNKSLKYTAFEPFPLTAELIQQLNFADDLKLNQNEKNFFFNLHNSKSLKLSGGGEITEFEVLLSKYQTGNILENIDVIFFDAFSPEKQPEMWLPEVFSKCYRELSPDGFLVTYCAKGEVKRTLKKCGFIVEALPGPPGKREMIRAKLAC